ncbi:MAG: hypothetical protein JWO10_2125 [Microbacteriaceae bacterium]|nr:hypothetical protein [Microbacteriaceae bacterium]
MALSRKQKKQLKNLRGSASDVWEDQKDVLERASRVIREATAHVTEVGKQDVVPRVQDGVAAGLATGRAVVEDAGGKLKHDVLPAVSSALASALAVLEVAKDPKVREALGRVGKGAGKLGSKVGITPAKSSSGPGKYILIAIGVVAVAGVAYAAWQTLRADDELWVSDDPEEDVEQEQ